MNLDADILPDLHYHVNKDFLCLLRVADFIGETNLIKGEVSILSEGATMETAVGRLSKFQRRF
jgi:hypothetical protein